MKTITGKGVITETMKMEAEKRGVIRISNLLVIVIMLLLVPALVIGIFKSFHNSKILSNLPVDIPMEEKYKLIERFETNVNKTETLEHQVDSLKVEVKDLKRFIRLKKYNSANAKNDYLY